MDTASSGDSYTIRPHKEGPQKAYLERFGGKLGVSLLVEVAPRLEAPGTIFTPTIQRHQTHIGIVQSEGEAGTSGKSVFELTTGGVDEQSLGRLYDTMMEMGGVANCWDNPAEYARVAHHR